MPKCQNVYGEALYISSWIQQFCNPPLTVKWFQDNWGSQQMKLKNAKILTSSVNLEEISSQNSSAILQSTTYSKMVPG